MNSPRTLEAMKILGLEVEELLPITYNSIKAYFIQRDRSADVPKDLIELRYKMLNDRRFSKRKLIVDKRNDLIAEENVFSGTSSKQSKRFISLESNSVSHLIP